MLAALLGGHVVVIQGHEEIEKQCRFAYMIVAVTSFHWVFAIMSRTYTHARIRKCWIDDTSGSGVIILSTHIGAVLIHS